MSMKGKKRREEKWCQEREMYPHNGDFSESDRLPCHSFSISPPLSPSLLSFIFYFTLLTFHHLHSHFSPSHFCLFFFSSAVAEDENSLIQDRTRTYRSTL